MVAVWLGQQSFGDVERDCVDEDQSQHVRLLLHSKRCRWSSTQPRSKSITVYWLLITASLAPMFSHVVIFWTDPKNPNAADELIAGMEKYLRPIPGALQMHIGKMVTSPRPVVEQSYQVALNLIFPNKKAQDDYQVHPLHVEFVNGVFKKTCQRVVVYDFEG
jgi:hypothetical protein